MSATIWVVERLGYSPPEVVFLDKAALIKWLKEEHDPSSLSVIEFVEGEAHTAKQHMFVDRFIQQAEAH